MAAKDLGDQLQVRQCYQKWGRSRASLGGKTPINRYCELMEKTPLCEEVETVYDPARELTGAPHCMVDVALATSPRSL